GAAGFKELIARPFDPKPRKRFTEAISFRNMGTELEPGRGYLAGCDSHYQLGHAGLSRSNRYKPRFLPIGHPVRAVVNLRPDFPDVLGQCNGLLHFFYARGDRRIRPKENTDHV